MFVFFRYDESLWRCVDMTKANLFPGLLGKVLKRGTRVLRLAHAKVNNNNNNINRICLQIKHSTYLIIILFQLIFYCFVNIG